MGIIRVCLYFTFIFWNGFSSGEDVQQNIAGVVYHKTDSVLFKAFKAGIKRLNEDKMLPHNKTLEIAQFKTDGRNLLGCDAVKKLREASCIFDLSFGDERSFALAELLRVPMVVLRPIYGSRWKSEFVFTMQPPEDSTAMATVNLLHYLTKESNVKKVAILAERKRSHLGARIFSLLRRRERVMPYMMPELVIGDDSQNTKALTELLRSGLSYVILVCPPKDMRALMEKAMRLGCVNKESKWITANMEIPGNISALALRGLLGIRLHATDTGRLRREVGNNRGYPEITGLTYAVLNDSMYVVGLAIRKMMLSPIIVDETKSNKYCPKNLVTTPGKRHNILNFLSKVNYQGFTGPVVFKQGSNERVVQIFDILNLQLQEDEQTTRKIRIGHLVNNETRASKITMDTEEKIFWNGEYWGDIQCEFRGKETIKAPPVQHKVLIVTVREDEPFMMIKPNASLLKGNDRYRGFSKDLMELLSRKLNFRYEIRISKESSYGSKVEGQWQGLIGELVREEADIALGPITITAEREEVIDFSKPFLDFRIAMILQQPTGEEVNLFAFLLPFDEKLWLTTLGVVGLVSLIVWFLDRFSPQGYKTQAEKSGEGEGDEFSLSNSLWFAVASILQQGGDNTPRSTSGRVLAAAFWLFTLILISTYTANLAAYFTAKSIRSKINSLEDLVSQNTVKYGVQEGGSLFTFFSESKVDIYATMFQQMKSQETFVNGTQYGVLKARTQPFAYLTDQPSLDYYNMRKPCNTMLVKNLLDAKSYALAMRRNSEWTNLISVAILELREEGEIEKSRLRWWDDSSECPTGPSTDSSPQRLELHSLAGVFIILGGGATISLVLLLVENKCRNVLEPGRPESPEGDETDALTRPAPAITANGGTELKLINNSERRQEPDGKNRRASPKPDSIQNRARAQPGYDLRIPTVYASAPESNL